MATSFFSMFPIVGTLVFTVAVPYAAAALELGMNGQGNAQTQLELQSAPLDATIGAEGQTSAEGTTSVQEDSATVEEKTTTKIEGSAEMHIRTPQTCRRMDKREQRKCLKLLRPWKHERKHEPEEPKEEPTQPTETENEPIQDPSKPQEEPETSVEPQRPQHEQPSGHREHKEIRKHRERILSSMKHLWRQAKDLSPDVRARLEAGFKAELTAAHEVCTEKFSRTEKSTCFLKAKAEARAKLRAQIQGELKKNDE